MFEVLAQGVPQRAPDYMKRSHRPTTTAIAVTLPPAALHRVLAAKAFGNGSRNPPDDSEMIESEHGGGPSLTTSINIAGDGD